MRQLAVDSDRNYLRRLQVVLTAPDFDVITATDGDAAIDRIHRDRDISVLLIDLSMPRHGIETVRQCARGVVISRSLRDPAHRQRT